MSDSLLKQDILNLNNFNEKSIDLLNIYDAWNFEGKKCGIDISNIDKFMCEFCEDSIKVLQDYDIKIRKKIINGGNKDFYKLDAKGIGIWSTTEPIIKYLIYTNLLDKYRMLPERTIYGNKKLLDLALYSEKIAVENVELNPDIAIEMKWLGIKKDGYLYNGWLNQIKSDVEKINKLHEIENKYLMFFSNLNIDREIDPMKVIETIYNSIDKRKFRNKNIKFIYSNYFPTMGWEVSDEWRFYIQLYKIV